MTVDCRVAHIACRVAVVGACLLAAARGSDAQTNERIYETVDFRFVTPGARAAGMGRTFVGLADDATAASSNPAGLANLAEQEFSLEFIVTEWTNRRFVPSETGNFQTSHQVVLTPSFFSYVLPIRRMTASFFLSSLQHYRDEFEFEGRFVPALNEPEDGAFGRIAVRADSYGFATSYVVSSFASVGGALVLTNLDLASEARSGTPLSPRNGTNTIDSGLRLSGTLGALFKLGRGVSAGAVYAHGSKFPITTRLFGSFLFTLPTDPPRRIDVVRSGEEHLVDYVIPTRFAAGVSWRTADSFTVLFDLARILYSQQVTSRFLVADFQDPDARLSSRNFFVNDVTEVHAGVEYRRYGRTVTTAVRAGVFTDPDHPLRFRSGSNNTDHPADATLDFRFNTVPARVEVGWSVGAGVALANWFQIDGAFTSAPRKREAVLSAVFRLRK